MRYEMFALWSKTVLLAMTNEWVRPAKVLSKRHRRPRVNHRIAADGIGMKYLTKLLRKRDAMEHCTPEQEQGTGQVDLDCQIRDSVTVVRSDGQTR